MNVCEMIIEKSEKTDSERWENGVRRKRIHEYDP